MLGLILGMAAALPSHALEPNTFDRTMHVTLSAAGLTVRLELQAGATALQEELERRGVAVPADADPYELLREAAEAEMAESVSLWIDSKPIVTQLFSSEVHRRHHITIIWLLQADFDVSGSPVDLVVEDHTFVGRPNARLRLSMSTRPEVDVIESSVVTTPVRAEPVLLNEAGSARNKSARSITAIYKLSDQSDIVTPPAAIADAGWAWTDNEVIWLSLVGLVGLALLLVGSRLPGHEGSDYQPS